jgi:hypothetical protein
MKVQYCGNCGKKTLHKVRFSFRGFFGGWFFILITCGVGLLLLPFLTQKRCIICGLTEKEARVEGDRTFNSSGKDINTGWMHSNAFQWIMVFIVLVAIIYIFTGK